MCLRGICAVFWVLQVKCQQIDTWFSFQGRSFRLDSVERGQGALLSKQQMARRAGYVAQTRWFAPCWPVCSAVPSTTNPAKALRFQALSLISSLMWNSITKTSLMTQPSIKLWTNFNSSGWMPALAGGWGIFIIVMEMCCTRLIHKTRKRKDS